MLRPSRGRSVRRLVLAALCGLIAFLALPREAAAQTTALFFDSQAGDYIGAGQPATYTPVDGTFSASTTVHGASFQVIGPGSAFWWHLDFKAAGPAPAPMPGVYEEARRASFTNFNGLDVGGSGRGCNEIVGRFVVLEAQYDGAGGVIRFAADFEQHCEDQGPALFGAIRYNSTISSLVPFGGAYPNDTLTLVPPPHGMITGGGFACGSGGAACSKTFAAEATVSLDATPDPGYVFAGWSGACSGGPHATVHVDMARSCSTDFAAIASTQRRTLAALFYVPNWTTTRQPLVLSPLGATFTLTAANNAYTLDMESVSAKRQDSNVIQLIPPTGQNFISEIEYPVARNADATHAAVRLTLDSLSCSSADTGSLMFREMAFGNGVSSDVPPTGFALDFQLECSGPLVGVILFNSKYAYPTIRPLTTALAFTGVKDQMGLVSHSVDQQALVYPTADLAWSVVSDQPWLTATPSGATGVATVMAHIKTPSALSGTSPFTGHLQPIARGVMNIPDPITVTLTTTAPDTTSRPFAVYRGGSGQWFAPNQPPQQFGLPGDVPLNGDFDGDGVIDTCVYRPSTGQWFVQGQGVIQWGLPGDVPVPADYNGDGITDVAVFRPGVAGGLWYIRGEAVPRPFGMRGDVPMPGDYDGDGIADTAVFRPADGTWWVVRSSTRQIVTKQFGLAGDVPVLADFDGDRKIDFAVYRPSIGTWYIAFSAGGSYTRQFGLPGDVPAPMDVTGDGRAELRVWRPSTGIWYTFDRWSFQSSVQQYGLPGDAPVAAGSIARRRALTDFDGDIRADAVVYRPATGEWLTRGSVAGASPAVRWGLPEDVPVAGDYDGGRTADRAVYRPSTGEWFVQRFDGTLLWRQWGLSGDVPVPSDYDGDGRVDMAVYRPGTGEWYVLTSASNYLTWQYFVWGLAGDVPITGDFDGDGRADFAVYRPSSGQWSIAGSSGAVILRQLGEAGDVPVPADFDGDGRAEIAVYRPSTGEWTALDAATGARVAATAWGQPGDLPVARDLDGDGRADIAVYRPSTGEWFAIRSSDGGPFYLQWGLPGDIVIAGR